MTDVFMLLKTAFDYKIKQINEHIGKDNDDWIYHIIEPKTVLELALYIKTFKVDLVIVDCDVEKWLHKINNIECKIITVNEALDTADKKENISYYDYWINK